MGADRSAAQMRKPRWRFASLFVAMIAGCASEHVAFALIDVPIEWQLVSNQRYRTTSCPLISGSYTSKGMARVFRSVEGKPQAPQDELVGAWRIGYSQRTGAREIVAPDDHRAPTGIRIDEVRIAQINETRYEVYRPQKGGKIEIASFDSTAGDFSCTDGIIHLAVKRQAGSSEGTTTHTELISSMYVADDGALIVKQRMTSKASSLIFLRSEIITEDYARFPRATPPPPRN
jgi:hypothetical protein